MWDTRGPKLTLCNAQQCLLANCTILPLFMTFSSLEDAPFCHWTNKHRCFSHLGEKTDE